MGRRKPLNRTGGHLSGAFGCKHVVGGGSPRVAIRDGKKYCLSTVCTTQQLDITAEPAAAKPAAAEPATAEPAAAEPPAAEPPAAEPAAAEFAAAKSAAAEPTAAEPTSIEPTLDHTTTLGGGDYDYDQTYDDIGGIYDSCDDYNYDSNPADDI